MNCLKSLSRSLSLELKQSQSISHMVWIFVTFVVTARRFWEGLKSSVKENIPGQRRAATRKHPDPQMSRKSASSCCLVSQNQLGPVLQVLSVPSHQTRNLGSQSSCLPLVVYSAKVVECFPVAGCLKLKFKNYLVICFKDCRTLPIKQWKRILTKLIQA